jgi:hypothetical protein
VHHFQRAGNCLGPPALPERWVPTVLGLLTKLMLLANNDHTLGKRHSQAAMTMISGPVLTVTSLQTSDRKMTVKSSYEWEECVW